MTIFLTNTQRSAIIVLSFIISLFFVMNTVKKIALGALPAAVALDTLTASAFNNQKPTTVDGSKQTADQAVQGIVNNAMVFLTILAVLYGIYGGFLMLTAGGEEDKVAKGRTILIQVAIGIIVIWLAGSIVNFVMGLLSGT